ncbi:nucleosome assembly protein 1-like 4 [Halichondria panicea]|uniref:nucleosome assembly protein 1-like 4 n=1 Tax=Halichondria panicea TaxID=6063 RepID=UPI00312B3CA8
MADQDNKISDVAEQALSGLKEDDIKKILSDGTAMSGLSQKLAAQINQALGGGNALAPPPPRDKQEMRRIRALKKLQLESTNLEAQFYIEVQKLESKYLVLNQPLFEKRRDIISGSHEPTDEEAHWSDDEDNEEEDVLAIKAADSIKDNGTDVDRPAEAGPSKDGDDDPSTGVEEFWLTAFKNCEIFTDIIKEEDESVLKHLIDLKVLYTDDTGMDFSLEFHFSDNEWFTNKVLTKSYKVTCEVNKDDPWAFEGAAIAEGKGCSIDWKKGKNLTVKTIKKKQKHKAKGQQARMVTKTVPSESFFNIFSPPNINSKDEAAEDEEDIAQALSDDYTRAEFIRDRLVPKAVLFFTGEALEEDGDDEDFDDDYDEDDDDLEGDDDGLEKQVAATKDQCKNQ